MQPQLRHGVGGHLPLEPDEPPPEQLAELFCAGALSLLFGDSIRDALHHLYEERARSHGGVEDDDAVVGESPGPAKARVAVSHRRTEP